MAKTYDLTKGNVTSLILRFYFPMFFTNLLQQVYTMADTAIIGSGLGDDATGAVGNMSSLTFLIIGFSLGLANGFCVTVAQKFGAKDYSSLRKAIASSIKLALILTVILTAVSLLFLKNVLILLQTNELLIDRSLTYGYIIFGGLFSCVAYNLCAGILRALGDSKTPLIAIIVSSVINVGLNSFTIFVMHTDVEGPAYATIIAQIFSTIICLNKLRKIEIIRLAAEDFRTDIAMYINLLKNGIAMALMNSITAVGSMVIQFYVNGYGPDYTSAYSVCMRYLNLFMDPACTAGFTMSAFTSQNYGAGKYVRIRQGFKVCMSIALVTYLVLGSLMFFIPETLAGLILNEKETIAIACIYLPISGATIFAVDFLFVYRSAVQAMGKPFIPMCSGIVEMVMRVGVMLACTSSLGFRATAVAGSAAWIGALILNAGAFYYFLGKKLHGTENSSAYAKNTPVHCK